MVFIKISKHIFYLDVAEVLLCSLGIILFRDKVLLAIPVQVHSKQRYCSKIFLSSIQNICVRYTIIQGWIVANIITSGTNNGVKIPECRDISSISNCLLYWVHVNDVYGKTYSGLSMLTCPLMWRMLHSG